MLTCCEPPASKTKYLLLETEMFPGKCCCLESEMQHFKGVPWQLKVNLQSSASLIHHLDFSYSFLFSSKGKHCDISKQVDTGLIGNILTVVDVHQALLLHKQQPVITCTDWLPMSQPTPDRSKESDTISFFVHLTAASADLNPH